MNSDKKLDSSAMITAAELEALIQGLGELPYNSIDKLFPFRFWCVLAIAFFYCCFLLFWRDVALQRMTSDPVDAIRMGHFMYFRGWFIAFLMLSASYAYIRNWFPAIVFSAIFLVACVNMIFDMFNIYAEALSRPTPELTLMLFGRIIGLWFLFLCAKNASRLPVDVRDRLNLFLFLKRE